MRRACGKGCTEFFWTTSERPTRSLGACLTRTGFHPGQKGGAKTGANPKQVVGAVCGSAWGPGACPLATGPIIVITLLTTEEIQRALALTERGGVLSNGEVRYPEAFRRATPPEKGVLERWTKLCGEPLDHLGLPRSWWIGWARPSGGWQRKSPPSSRRRNRSMRRRTPSTARAGGATSCRPSWLTARGASLSSGRPRPSWRRRPEPRRRPSWPSGSGRPRAPAGSPRSAPRRCRTRPRLRPSRRGLPRCRRSGS